MASLSPSTEQTPSGRTQFVVSIGKSSGQPNPRGSSSENTKKPRTNLLVILAIAIVCAGCAVARRPFAKPQLIVPHDCILSIEMEPDTECRQNLDGTGELVCKPLKMNRKPGCGPYVTPPPKGAPNAPATPEAPVPNAEGGVPEPR